jgi:hypothetical protein
MARWLILVALLAGCGAKESTSVKPDIPVAKGEPITRTYQVNGSEMVVVDVPVPGVTRANERQTCYIWRDKAMTSSMQCPSDSKTVTLDPPEK